MHRAAVLAFPDATGRNQARLVLERGTSPAVNGTAAWLMCNPSDADHETDDPTVKRVVHHSARAGCPRSLVGNVWPLRTPYPADLWRMLEAGALTDDMRRANLDALAMIGAQANVHIVAYGCAPQGRDQVAVAAALEAFSLQHTVPLYCLGESSGQPLHPLARGKLAVRNDAELRLWKPAYGPVKRWDDVFSDKRQAAVGWVDR